MKIRGTSLLLALLLAGCAAGNGETVESSFSQVREEPSPQQIREEISVVSDLSLKELTHRLMEATGEEREEYLLLSGTELERPVSVLRGKEQGGCVYIVGGIHGDEPAGWLAGQLMKQAEPAAGTVYILSPANRYGADKLQRKTKQSWDLNRNFPGKKDGTDAERIAAALYEDIAAKKPDIVLDLHEALAPEWERDALQNTIICQSAEELGDLVMGILTETEAGRLCNAPFSLYGSPPEGSIHRTLVENLGIPVITIETDRQQPLKARVANQLDLIGYILEWYGLCSLSE